MSIATNNRIPFYPFSDIRVARIVKPRGEREYNRKNQQQFSGRARRQGNNGPLAVAAALIGAWSNGKTRVFEACNAGSKPAAPKLSQSNIPGVPDFLNMKSRPEKMLEVRCSRRASELALIDAKAAGDLRKASEPHMRQDRSEPRRPDSGIQSVDIQTDADRLAGEESRADAQTYRRREVAPAHLIRWKNPCPIGRKGEVGGRANTIKTQGDDNPRSSATPTPKAVPGNGGGLDGVGSRFDVWL